MAVCCCTGLGCEDALMHLLNLVWPNIFEISPHVVQAVTGAINGCRLALGPAVILSYLLQGLWHPARWVAVTAPSCSGVELGTPNVCCILMLPSFL
jgi:hypothetical protein